LSSAAFGAIDVLNPSLNTMDKTSSLNVAFTDGVVGGAVRTFWRYPHVVGLDKVHGMRPEDAQAERSSPYQTRELSAETWSDFERLFGRGNGWDHCWCMAFQRAGRPSRQEFRTRAEVGPRNRAAKKALVEQGRAHGILVYLDGAAVGWCQFGPATELRGCGSLEAGPADDDNVWRVTCFVVDKKHRRGGVAGVALRAALEAIRTRGGRIVEAYPVASWTHGRDAAPGAVYVQGVGPVAPAWGGFGNVSHTGIASMFEKEGFEAVAVCTAQSARVRSYGAQGYQVLMRRAI
jgi:GNAT superfamily N-acetyltransferase